MAYDYVTDVKRNMSEMSREYEWCEYINTTFTLFVKLKHIYDRNSQVQKMQLVLAILRPYHSFKLFNT